MVSRIRLKSSTWFTTNVNQRASKTFWETSAVTRTKRSPSTRPPGCTANSKFYEEPNFVNNKISPSSPKLWRKHKSSLNQRDNQQVGHSQVKVPQVRFKSYLASFRLIFCQSRSLELSAGSPYKIDVWFDFAPEKGQIFQLLIRKGVSIPPAKADKWSEPLLSLFNGKTDVKAAVYSPVFSRNRRPFS